MKCILCNRRKGKRFCPAKETGICAQCCGEKRVLVIDCPETCEYLQVGRSHESRQEHARHIMTSDPVKLEKRRRILTEFEDFVAHLEFHIGKERRATRSLRDGDVEEALRLLVETLRTEDKGIVYEHTSNNLVAESLRRGLHELVEHHRHPEDGDVKRIKLKDAIECLDFLREVVASHMREGAMSYVDYLVRMLPRDSGLEGPGSSIIVPGR